MRSALIAGLLTIGLGTPVEAQFNGHNLKGDYGLLSGSQAAPGFYLSPLYYGYSADDLLDRDGNSLRRDDEQPGNLDADAASLIFLYVTNLKLLGGNVGFLVAPSLTNNALSIPISGISSRTSTGFGDLYLQPLMLGWNAKRADFTAGLGLTAPTGEWELGGDSNRGLGMWSFEVFAGTSIYLDEEKSWHFATAAFFETHTDKRDTDIRVGDILTLEGGLGKSFLEGALNVGVSYYAQWKLTNDDFGLDFDVPGGPVLGKHRVYGFGPELTVPIATKEKLYALLNVRYFWESGARTMVEGSTLLITAALPLPSISLN